MNTTANTLAVLSHLTERPQQDFCLETGLVLRAGPTVFRVTEIREEVVTLEHTVSLERKVIHCSRLLTEIAEGRVLAGSPGDEGRALEGDLFTEDERRTIARFPLDEFSDAQRQQALRVLRYIYGLRRIGYVTLAHTQPTIQLDLDRLRRKYNDPKPAKATWVYKWALELDKAGGDPRAVIPRFDRRGGAGSKRLDPITEGALSRALQAVKGDQSAKVATRKVLNDAKSIVQVEHPERADLVISLNWSTVDRRVKETFTAYDICRRNQGKEVARRKYREWYPRDRAEYPLEVVETDDTDACVFLIDEKSGLPAGRGFLTSVLDQYSQNCHGFELSHKPRSTWSAVSSLIHAILPKDAAHPDFADCKMGCEFFGKPGVVVFDNAVYNHAHEVEEAAWSIGIAPAWAKPKTPTEKSNQEGWFGRLKRDFLPDLPGFRGDKKLREGLKDGLASANMGLLEFRQAFVKWAYDVYANQPQEPDGLTPRQRWCLGMRLARPRLPRDIYGLKLVPSLHATKKIRQKNILFCGLLYHSPFLKLISDTYGHNADVRFRFNPGNLGEIFAFDPKLRHYVPIPAVNLEYARGLTLFQHRLIRKMVRDTKVRNPSIPQLLLFREQLRLLTCQLRFSKKLKDRKRAARTDDIEALDLPDSGSKRSRQEAVVVTELEDQILQIDQVEMELEDDGWTLPSD